jgi:hypothetical protein
MVIQVVSSERYEILTVISIVIVNVRRPDWPSRYRDYATGWKIRDSNAGKGKIFSSLYRLDWFWGPHLLFSEDRGFFPAKKRLGCEVDHTPLSSPRLGMSGAMHLLPLYAFRAGSRKTFNRLCKPY